MEAATFLEVFLVFFMCFLEAFVVADFSAGFSAVLGAFCAANAVPRTIAAPIINAESLFMVLVSFPFLGLCALTSIDVPVPVRTLNRALKFVKPGGYGAAC